MSEYQEKDFLYFESLIAPWIAAYRFADIAYVGVQTKAGPRLIQGRIVLNPFNVIQGYKTFEFESAHVIAGRYLLDLTKHSLSSILRDLRNGELLTANDIKVCLQNDNGFNVFCSPVRHPFVTEGMRLPNINVRGSSKFHLMSNIMEHFDIDWELKAAKVPFDNLDDLLRECGLLNQSDMGDSTSLEIVAGCPAFITEKSIIAKEEGVIECRVSSALDVEKLRLGYKLHRGDVIVRRESVSGSNFEWKQEEDSKIGTLKLDVGDASLLQAIVSFSDVAQHLWWVVDPSKRLNPRHAIHQIFDEELDVLRKQLFKPETDKAHMFEQAVSMLLNLAGFSASNYGRIPKLQKGPDIIAISTVGNIAVVECTLGLINENNKLAKLVQRTQLIRDRLNSSGYGHQQIQPVVATPLSRSEILVDLEEAGKHGIAVICREDLEGMLERISLPLNPDKLFEDTKSLVPTKMQGVLGSNW